MLSIEACSEVVLHGMSSFNTGMRLIKMTPEKAALPVEGQGWVASDWRANGRVTNESRGSRLPDLISVGRGETTAAIALSRSGGENYSLVACTLHIQPALGLATGHTVIQMASAGRRVEALRASSPRSDLHCRLEAVSKFTSPY